MISNQRNLEISSNNLDASEINIENQVQQHITRASSNDEAVINIEEFIFNHITAERDGSIFQDIRRKVAIHSKILIKSWTIIDIVLYILFLFIPVFLIIQK